MLKLIVGKAVYLSLFEHLHHSIYACVVQFLCRLRVSTYVVIAQTKIHYLLAYSGKKAHEFYTTPKIIHQL